MEISKKQEILVYTDFTSVSEKSILWAIFLAKNFNVGLHIIHVINENSHIYFSKSNMHAEITEVLLHLSEQIHNDHNIITTYTIEEGCTCTMLNSTATKIDALLIVVGVHSKNDMQFLSATSAVKMIRKSNIPYFIVREHSQMPDTNKNIVISIDSTKEKKEQVSWVSYFAKHLSTEVEMFYYDIDDLRIKNNILFCTRFFDKLNIKYNYNGLEKKIKSLNSTMISNLNNRKDLCIVTIMTKNENILHRIFGFPETQIICNKLLLPTLCINPRHDLYIPCV